MFSTARRFSHISLFLLPPFFGYLRYKNNPESEKFQKNAVAMRKHFQQLGTTFIKLGQMLSSRPDIIGPGLSQELRNLLDNEPEIPFSSVKKVVETELQQELSHVFESFEEIPLATASIAQVHKAKLKSGKIVAVKVQRPGISKAIEQDLAVFRFLSGFLDFLTIGKKIKFSYVYKEFADWLHNELDFQVEGRRADKFRENMKSVDGVRIPQVYWKETTTKILTMEFMHGITVNALLNEMKRDKVNSLSDLKTTFKINPDTLIKHTIAALAKQALEDRYFHGDLHPANLIIQKNNEVCFVDFGIIGTLDNQEYMELVFVLLALVDNDPDALLKALLALVTQPLNQDQTTEIHELLSEELHKVHEDTGGKVGLNHFITTVLTVASTYQMLWTPGLLLAIKTIGQIDFVAGQIGIHEPMVDMMKPEVEKYVLQALSTTISKEELFKGMLDIFQAGKKLPSTIDELEQLISSGQFIKVSPPSSPSINFVKWIFSAVISLIISFFLITQTVLSTSPYKPVLVLVIPLVLFIILNAVTKKREGVK